MLNRWDIEALVACLVWSRRWFGVPGVYVLQADGLGNQLSRHAFAECLAEAAAVPVFTNTQMFAADLTYTRLPELDRIGIATAAHQLPWNGPRLVHLLGMLRRLPLGLTWVDDARAADALRRCRRGRSRFVLQGYFQTQPVTQRVLDDVRSRVLATRSAHRMADPGDETVAVHFRRVQFDNVLGPAYYSNALQRLDPGGRAVVDACGDSIPDWAEKVAWPRTLRRLAHVDGVEAFLSLSGYRKLVLANSTFSYWAARIRADQVVAPSCLATQLRLPESWIVVEGATERA